MKYASLAALLSLTFLFTGCKKQSDSELSAHNCEIISRATIEAPKTSFIVGDAIHLQIKEMPDIALFIWTHTNTPNAISSDRDVDITYAEKADEGWYYMNVSYPECAAHTDSVYITVKNKVTTAPCSPKNNAVSFSAIPDIDPATVSWSYNTSWNRRVLAANGAYGYPDFNIYFNTFWDTKEPEDGEYNVTTMAATGEYPPYTVYISSLYSGVFFQGTGKVFVSHVGGKLRVTFCDIKLTGSNGGTSFSTTASGALTAP
jgi:hypothetical protein